ncbi:hypothetical protein SPWS13_2861 [Shewanella putrefaciens]|nr:hypothetical protein SPWS13_2861 [Shewanella putrefaciens]
MLAACISWFFTSFAQVAVLVIASMSALMLKRFWLKLHVLNMAL